VEKRGIYRKTVGQAINCVVQLDENIENGLTTDQKERAFMAVSESFGLTEARGLIGGNECTMALDSGATVNIIAKSFANECGFNLFKTNIPVKMADGWLVKEPEKTAMLKIEVFGNQVSQEFVVIKGMVDKMPH